MQDTASLDPDVLDLYQRVILDRSRNPSHLHAMEHADAHGRGDNPFCGDEVAVALRYGPDGHVAEAAFDGRGCAIMMASADLMAEVAAGLDAASLRALAGDVEKLARTGDAATPDLLRPLAGLAGYPSRVRCATLPWQALLAALSETPPHG